MKQEFTLLGGWRSCSALKSSNCSCRGPGSNSKYPHGGSQPSVTAVLEALIPSPRLLEHQACMWYTDIPAGKTLTPKINLKNIHTLLKADPPAAGVPSAPSASSH